MSDKKYTLDELTTEVNKILKEVSLVATDSRQSKEFSARRIRGLVSDNLISKPLREGRTVYYTEKHLNELIDFKTLQSSGLSEKSLLSFKNEIKENENENVSLDELIKKMKSNRDNEDEDLLMQGDLSYFKNKGLMQSLSSYSSHSTDIEKNNTSVSALRNITKPNSLKAGFENIKNINNRLLNEDGSITPETWNEYALSNNVILKVKVDTELTDLDSIIENLKKINKQLNK